MLVCVCLVYLSVNALSHCLCTSTVSPNPLHPARLCVRVKPMSTSYPDTSSKQGYTHLRQGYTHLRRGYRDVSVQCSKDADVDIPFQLSSCEQHLYTKHTEGPYGLTCEQPAAPGVGDRTLQLALKWRWTSVTQKAFDSDMSRKKARNVFGDIDILGATAAVTTSHRPPRYVPYGMGSRPVATWHQQR